jgi:hypothetical protein
MPNTYVALRTETVAVATGTVTIDLTGISGYTDLVLVASTSTGDNLANFTLRFNSDSGANYSSTSLEGQGTSAVSQRQSNQNQMYIVGFQNGSYTEPFTSILQIQNYSNTTTNKTVLIRSSSNAASAYVGLWRSTAAITSIAITSVSSTFSIGSTFSLYGIANADQGSAKATGGIITEDSQYWYHTFGASGAFIPKQSLTCDVLVVAGGGGGGNAAAGNTYAGGGGGAGGYRIITAETVSTLQNVTVGSGGAIGTVGNNSIFSSTTSAGGGLGANGSLSVANGGAGGSGGASTNGGTGGAASPAGQGNAGATSSATWGSSGGGGGAGAAGANVTSATGGAGGAGLTNSLSGFSVTYAGGGGGGSYSSGGFVAGGAGGAGGGGAGGSTAGTGSSGVAGTVNTGGGGGGSGGGGSGGASGAAGGSGIVIVRYAK